MSCHVISYLLYQYKCTMYIYISTPTKNKVTTINDLHLKVSFLAAQKKTRLLSTKKPFTGVMLVSKPHTWADGGCGVLRCLLFRAKKQKWWNPYEPMVNIYIYNIYSHIFTSIQPATNQAVFWSLLTNLVLSSFPPTFSSPFWGPSGGILNHSNDAQRRRSSRKRRYPGHRESDVNVIGWLPVRKYGK